MIWDAEAETLPRERLELLQRDRLQATVARLLHAVPPIRDRLHAAGLTSEQEITSLADITRLPFTEKADLREHYPFGLFAVPRERGRPHPRLERHPRQADGRRLHRA